MKIDKGYLIGGLIALCIGLCALTGLTIGFAIDNKKIFDLNALSDLATILAGVASLVGLVLLYITYQSQKKELKASKDAFQHQKVDTAFFNMLSLLQEMVSAMSDTVVSRKGGEEKVEGRTYLKEALRQLHNAYLDRARINMRPNPQTGGFNSFQPSTYFITHDEKDKNNETVNLEHSISYRDLVEEVSAKYEEFYSEHQQNLGHYFRYVYNIIKYVLDPVNQLDEPDKHRYLGILQSQLSNDEMGLIFYNSISKHSRTSNGEYRFLKWLDKYKLLENMDRQSLKEAWHHWFYPKTLFKFLDNIERDRKNDYINNLIRFDIPA